MASHPRRDLKRTGSPGVAGTPLGSDRGSGRHGSSVRVRVMPAAPPHLPLEEEVTPEAFRGSCHPCPLAPRGGGSKNRGKLEPKTCPVLVCGIFRKPRNGSHLRGCADSPGSVPDFRRILRGSSAGWQSWPAPRESRPPPEDARGRGVPRGAEVAGQVAGRPSGETLERSSVGVCAGAVEVSRVATPPRGVEVPPGNFRGNFRGFPSA